MTRRWRAFSLRLGGLCAVLIAALVALAGLALAAAPVKGGRYSGHLAVSASETVSFKVSSNGKKVTGLTGPAFAPNTCGSGGPPPSQSSSPASISGGKFSAKITYRTGTGHAIATVTVKGKFKKHRKETGTMRTHFLGTGAAMCEHTFTYSAHA
jgi:hypothetical protein